MQSRTPVQNRKYLKRPARPAGERHGSTLRALVVLTGVVPVIASGFIDAPVPWTTRALAVALWVLCVTPIFYYLGQDPRFRRPIPFFPVLNLIFGLYYVLPLVLGVVNNYYNAPVRPETDYDYPVQLVFLGWVMMFAGYVATGLILPTAKRPRPVAWKPDILTRWGLILMYGGMLATAAGYRFALAAAMGGTFQFILSVQWLGTGILIILARRRELSVLGLVLLVAGFMMTTAMLLANGNVAPVALFFTISAFALWVAKPHLPRSWIIGAICAALVATSFRGIVIDFRRTVADAGVPQERVGNLQTMVRLLEARVQRHGIGGAIQEGLVSTAGRSAILDLFANIARRTPAEVPFWKGQTYLSLVGSMVPRVFWPDKPTKNLGQAFGHRYNLIHASNKTTAINLPILVEFFVNFGGVGVVLGMLLVGLIYRVLDALVNRPGQSELLSMIGIVILLPLVLIESDFSLVLGGLPLTGAAFFVIWKRFAASLGSPARAPAIANRPAGPRIPSNLLAGRGLPPLGSG